MNLLPTDQLELAIYVFKNTLERRICSGQLSGRVAAGIEFSSIRLALDNTQLLISSNEIERTIESHLPSGFFESLDNVLSSPARRIKAPSRFYLADSDSFYEGDETVLPTNASRYLAATKLYSLLSRAADHQGGVGDAKTLIFLGKEKIEITPQYSILDLIDISDLAEFEIDFISTNTHTDQKRTILKTSLFEHFAGRKKVPFSELLSNFGDFMERIRASYQLYVAEFSFQKVKVEVEKEKLDAMVKLNKVFSDMQNQLLAVPVALVLVGGQMENKGDWVSKNVLIWLGALIFTILMDLLIRNQRHTLRAVKNEIDQQRQQIESKYQSVAGRFQTIYKEIDDRHVHQNRLISVIDALVASCFAIATTILLYFSGIL